MARILIVDDEQDVVFLMRHLLKTNGFEVCEAPNGLAALRLFQTQFFDLVITDLRMPTMDGLAFLTEVKKLDPATPVVILTAYASPETAAEAIAGGAFVYLAKPYKTDDLLNAVKRALTKGKGGGPSARLASAG